MYIITIKQAIAVDLPIDKEEKTKPVTTLET